jgi:hypothetical protein
MFLIFLCLLPGFSAIITLRNANLELDFSDQFQFAGISTVDGSSRKVLTQNSLWSAQFSTPSALVSVNGNTPSQSRRFNFSADGSELDLSWQGLNVSGSLVDVTVRTILKTDFAEMFIFISTMSSKIGLYSWQLSLGAFFLNQGQDSIFVNSGRPAYHNFFIVNSPSFRIWESHALQCSFPLSIIQRRISPSVCAIFVYF